LTGTSGSDEDDIEIITCSQVAATRGGLSNHSMMPFGVAIDVEEEVEIPVMPQNGWGYERAPNHYSDEEDEGYVEVAGVIVPAPRSRGRTVGKSGDPLPFRIQTVSLKVLDLEFKVLDEIT
jgi:hypothetical protein